MGSCLITTTPPPTPTPLWQKVAHILEQTTASPTSSTLRFGYILPEADERTVAREPPTDRTDSTLQHFKRQHLNVPSDTKTTNISDIRSTYIAEKTETHN